MLIGNGNLHITMLFQGKHNKDANSLASMS